jgi:hypothetical protein
VGSVTLVTFGGRSIGGGRAIKMYRNRVVGELGPDYYDMNPLGSVCIWRLTLWLVLDMVVCIWIGELLSAQVREIWVLMNDAASMREGQNIFLCCGTLPCHSLRP